MTGPRRPAQRFFESQLRFAGTTATTIAVAVLPAGGRRAAAPRATPHPDAPQPCFLSYSASIPAKKAGRGRAVPRCAAAAVRPGAGRGQTAQRRSVGRAIAMVVELPQTQQQRRRRRRRRGRRHGSRRWTGAARHRTIMALRPPSPPAQRPPYGVPPTHVTSWPRTRLSRVQVAQRTNDQSEKREAVWSAARGGEATARATSSVCACGWRGAPHPTPPLFF